MKKLTVSIFELCDYAAVSQDNKLSIMGIFDQVFARSFPSQHGRMFIVGVVKGDAGSDHKLSFRILNPSNANILPDLNLDVKLGPNGKSNLIAEVNNIPLKEQGLYMVECLEGESVIGTRELFVRNAGDQPAPSGNNKLPN